MGLGKDVIFGTGPTSEQCLGSVLNSRGSARAMITERNIPMSVVIRNGLGAFLHMMPSTKTYANISI